MARRRSDGADIGQVSLRRALSVSTAGLALVASAAPAFADNTVTTSPTVQGPVAVAKVKLLTTESAPVTPGTSAWYSLNWTAEGGKAWDFKVLVDPGRADIAVTYPENTATFTSLYRDDILSQDEIDYTSFTLTVPNDVSGPLPVKLKVSYKTGEPANPVVIDDLLTVSSPVTTLNGSGLEQLTTSLGTIKGDSVTWVDVAFAGKVPLVDKVALTVTDNAGFAIAYPNEAAFASLLHSSSISAGQKDVARFRIDTTGKAAGTYQLTLHTVYYSQGTTAVIDVPVSVTVAVPDAPSPTTGGCKVCVFGTSGTTLSVTGAASVKAVGAVAVASNSTGSIVVSGSGSITSAASVTSAGTATMNGNATITPKLTTGAAPADPFASRPTPAVVASNKKDCSLTPTSTSSACATSVTTTATGMVLASGNYGKIAISNATLSIGPGQYDSMSLDGVSRITLRPGVYVFAGDGLTVNGGSAVSGSDATLYLSDTAKLILNGNAPLTLAGRTTGEYAGMAIFASRTNATTIEVNGSSTLTTTTNGSIYAPAAKINVSGASVVTTGDRLAVGSAVVSGSARIIAG